jgi:hypothetical protein
MTWQDLTEQEKKQAWYSTEHIMGWYSFQEIAEVIEAKLKEKNEKNCTGHRDEHGSRYDPFVRNSGH